jgi:GNAT superfamily N-acetyltransferase
MNRLRILKVSSRKDLLRFIRFPWVIYKDNPYWIPPLIYDRKKLLDKVNNPFYQHAEMELFLALSDNKVVGRIAAIKNEMHIKYHNNNCGFFGFFECIDDQDTANLLIDAAIAWLKEKGVTSVMGPANPSSNDDWGLLIDGFNLSPAFMMPYNPEYYIRLIETYGFTKIKDLNGYQIKAENVLKVEKLKRLIESIKTRNKITIKQLDKNRFEEDLAKVKLVYNKAWAPNWGFVPLTEPEIDSIASEMKMLLEPSLTLFVEREHETIGFTLTMPDYNQLFKKMNGRLFPFGIVRLLTQKRRINAARILTLGIIPEYQKKGIDAVIYWELLNNAAKLGIYTGEASWILEDNEMMNNAILNMGGELYKRYRIYHLNF